MAHIRQLNVPGLEMEHDKVRHGLFDGVEPDEVLELLQWFQQQMEPVTIAVRLVLTVTT
jgi:hypothetical protein